MLGGRALGGTDRGSVNEGPGRRPVVRASRSTQTIPCSLAQPLGQPPDERLVAGPDRRELGADGELAVVVGDDHDVRCRRMKPRPPARGRRPPPSASRSCGPRRGTRPDPRLDLREESVGWDLPGDEPSLGTHGRSRGGRGASWTLVLIGTSDDTTPRRTRDRRFVPVEAAKSRSRADRRCGPAPVWCGPVGCGSGLGTPAPGRRDHRAADLHRTAA